MEYCTRGDLVQRFGQTEIADLLDGNNDGQDDQQKLSSRVQDAEALINGYLGAKYAVPVVGTIPQAIKLLACDIVRYLLWDDRAPEEVRKRYDDAVNRLKDYARGLMVLPELPAAPTNTSGGVDYFAEERVFTRDSLSGFG